MRDKLQNFILTPIKVSYKDRSDYTPIENFILNPIILALIVFLVTYKAFSLNDNIKPSASDTALSNAMIYFEKGDFDNAVLQLETVVDNFSGTKAAHQAKFYLGRTAFINGNNDKALVYLSESVSKIKYDNLKKEGYIIYNMDDDELHKALKNNPCQKQTFSIYRKDTLFHLDKNKIIYGFDSFAGLEEEWISSDYNPVGKFSLNQKKPKLPKNVKIVQGRVEDTIETFLKDNSGNKIIFSHMDMDNYNPTKYTLEKIKPFLTQGSIVLFDEFYGFQGWKNPIW